MKTIINYINEARHSFRIKSHLKKYKYTPDTKEELIEAIKTELDAGNTDLNCIDTSNITDMGALFWKQLTKEQQETLDISEWDTSKVKSFNSMFFECKSFNSDLSKWDVSNVENMDSMFFECENFNSDLSKWNVSKVIDFSATFLGCKRFNSDLSKWNVSNATDMSYMFLHCEQFNCDLSKWDVSNVEHRAKMFDNSGLEGKEPKWYEK